MASKVSLKVLAPGFAILLGLSFSFAIGPHPPAYGQNSAHSALSRGDDSDRTAGEVSKRQGRRDVKVTRWIDLDGSRPMTYLEWKAQVGEIGPFEINFVGERSGLRQPAAGIKMCVIVNTAIHSEIQFHLDRYVIELTGEGYDVEVYTTSGGTPEDLRAFLQRRYAAGMAGCILIGDMPVPWYETVGCWDEPGERENFPCDIFYMDLNGDFGDANSDDVYDSHTGSVAPDIWVGRLTASPLVTAGADEVSLLQNYFDKNHLYRSELGPLNERALLYIDDDWAYDAEWWEYCIAKAYDERTVVSDEWTTWHDDYEDRLTHNYELIQVCVHSSSGYHTFYHPDFGWGQTSQTEVIAIDPTAYFYNLFACSNARYVASQYMGGWYIFCDTYGLAALGSTKTGSMLNFDSFYGPFGQGQTFGEAFRDWFTDMAEAGFDPFEQCWFHGMTLLGDPTLRQLRDGTVVITPVVLPDGEVDAPYNETLTVTGGLAPYTWEVVAGEMPDGLGMNLSTGIISGTPTLAGTGYYTFTVRVTDSDGPPEADIQHLTITVSYCVDTDGDGFGDPGHPANTCPTDNCPAVFNSDQEDVDGDGIGDSCEVIRTWYVQADGMGDAPTIQAAIDSCTHGDTVIVADGVFTGEGNRDLDLRGRRILIKSENGSESTIIDCQGTSSEPHRAFAFQNGEDSSWVVEGFTIHGGYGPFFTGSYNGGGMLFNNSSPTVNNCLFTGNSAIMGGALFVYESAPRLVNCTFYANSAYYGAALFSYNRAHPLLENCIIAFNLESQPVVCMDNSDANLTCSDVYGNAGGDWVDCLNGQDGADGNFSADPLFCDTATADFHIADISFCAPANNSCDTLIGALGVGCGGICVDTDGDGYGDPGHPENWCPDDNCPTVYNVDQTDTDGDGEGDVCDDDDDDDTIPDATDNCPLVANPGQEDDDGDGAGNVCDLCPGYDDKIDQDEDNVPDGCDNCPLIANADQADADSDGEGDACDDDDDGDGIPDVADNCPLAANPGQENNDGDEEGDVCDADDDNDGVPDAADNCPFTVNAGQENNDGDSEGDACDDDDDNDGVPDVADNCPLAANPGQENADGDPQGDACDNDDDNDGILDYADNCPLVYNPGQEDSDHDGVGDACEDCDCRDFCDLFVDGSYNPIDVVLIVNYVYKAIDDRPVLPLCPADNGDWYCDGSVNPIDVVYYVNFIYKAQGLGPCDPCAPK